MTSPVEIVVKDRHGLEIFHGDYLKFDLTLDKIKSNQLIIKMA